MAPDTPWNARFVFWFRNDLRLRDNRALVAIARRAHEWIPVYVLDPGLLASERSGPGRVRFLLDGVERLAAVLAKRGSPLLVLRGRPEEILPRLMRATRADGLGFNRDTTPYARTRDARVTAAVERLGAQVTTCKDRVVFEKDEIRSGKGSAYSVFSPYARTWRARWREAPMLPERAPRLPRPVADLDAALTRARLCVCDARTLAPAADGTRIPAAGEDAARRRLEAFLETGLEGYGRRRDLPAVDGTSRLSPFLRFGAISVRECVAAADERALREPICAEGAERWIRELVWRDFYAGVLEANPRVLRENFRPEFDALRWEDDEAGFAAWCEGRTGFPIVDAGMRQLLSTGWMHNRVRMITASFLTKDLLVDWRRGEAWFHRLLVDADPASNNGGWQWAASTGTDAQPWFRIFNPVRQGERFDPDGAYVRHWIPELAGVPDVCVHRPWEAPLAASGYPAPIVDHVACRARALLRFERARHRGSSRSLK